MSAVSIANAAFPAATGFSSAGSVSRGDPSVDFSNTRAFIGTDFVFYGDAFIPAESVMHDALAESSGQTAYAENNFGARDFVRRFSLPARGINWGTLHPYNAVDVAGACGSGVYAAAAGQVTDVHDGWGGGYGNYVDIDHSNGITTRYAHAESVLAKVGQMVAGGDVIARMGNTGNSSGCHVHFEVLGSAAPPNPFATK